MSGSRVESEMWTHPAHGSLALDTVKVSLERLSPTNVRVRYEAIGRIDDLVIPEPAPPLRSDNLWKATCFELFLRGDLRTGYREFNFSPSGQWAAYEFRGYRDGMTHAQLPGEPIVQAQALHDRLIVDVRLSMHLPEEPYRMSLSAVAQERTVGTSYWAVSHAGGVPDFHHPACFALELPPAPAS